MIVCPHDRADLCRNCVHYEPCGHTVTSEPEGWDCDGGPCDPLPGRQSADWTPHHLWLRRPALVAPTLDCRLARAAHRSVIVIDPTSMTPSQDQVPHGEVVIHGWRVTAAGVLQVILENSPVMAVA